MLACFRNATTSRPTGELLKGLVSEEMSQHGTFTWHPYEHRADVLLEPGAKLPTICYGLGLADAELENVTDRARYPVLNGSCSRYNKYEQLLAFQRTGIACLNAFVDTHAPNATYPAYGRQLSHTRGRDITLAMDRADAVRRRESGSQFFTTYEPSNEELRVWVYRNRHLGTYRKTLTRPEQYKRLGRNYSNGWSFTLVPAAELQPEATTLAANAVAALGLDFGAVDILYSLTRGRWIVLEVNTAPGVEGAERQVIQSLTKHICRWMLNGCPRRARWRGL